MSQSIRFLDILRSRSSFIIKLWKLADYCASSLLGIVLPPRKPRSFIESDLKKILVIRPGGIGDAVLLMSLLFRIKAFRKDVVIDVLCERRNKSIFESQPKVIHQCFLYTSFKDLRTVVHGAYDLVIDSEQFHYMSALIAYMMPGYSVGFATTPRRAKLFNKAVSYDLNEYELASFEHLFHPFFPDLQNKKSDVSGSFEVSNEDDLWASGIVPQRAVSLFLGGSLPEKHLTVNQIVEILKFLNEKNAVPILLGGKDYLDKAGLIKARSEGATLIDLVGKISLSQAAAVIRRTQLYVGTDSGLLHLAWAVGTPTIAVFTSSNPLKWSPRGERDVSVSAHLPCAPCARLSYSLPTCHGQHYCVRDINVAFIKDEIAKKI